MKAMNVDLKRERANAAFNVERITHVLDGGKEKTERRRFLEQVIERDPTGLFANDENNYLHRTDRHRNGIAKGVRLIEICRKLGIGDECEGRITESQDFQVILEAVADDIPLCTYIVTMFFFNKAFKVFEKQYGTIVNVFVFVSFILPLSLRCTYFFPFFQPSHSCITRNIRDLIDSSITLDYVPTEYRQSV